MQPTKLLICSDIHLDDKDRNEYRWKLFPWIKEQSINNNIKYLIIAGDIFHEKDRHSSYLINKFIDNLLTLVPILDQILILKGNHDVINYSNPYLRWINQIPKIKFFIEPETIIINNKNFLFLPNTKQPIDEWKILSEDFNKADYIICHQTFQGAIAENGSSLAGLSQTVFNKTSARILSGDIHQPQNLGRVTYIGTPYPITFNIKNIKYRTILVDLDSGKETNLIHNNIKKHTIFLSKPEELDSLKLNQGDQVKIRLALDDVSNWENYKVDIANKCKNLKIDYQIEFDKKDSSLAIHTQESKLKDLTTDEIFNRFCTYSKVGEDTKEFGKSLLTKD